MFFNKNTFNSSEWLDIIFANRNKEYGAYQLRKYSSRATNIALLIVLSIVVGLCGLSFIVGKGKASIVEVSNPDLFFTEVDLLDEKELTVEPLVEESKNEIEKPAQIAQEVSALDLVKFNEINPSSKPSSEDLASINDALDKKVLLSSVNMKGMPGGEIMTNGTFGKAKREGLTTGVSSGDPNGKTGVLDFEAVEVLPRPPGGMEAFVRWVANNYRFSETAIQHQANGLVQVSFIVETDGTLSSIKVLRDIGFGTGDEAIRLLEKAERWRPGVQNGIPVRVSYTLPIRLNSQMQ